MRGSTSKALKRLWSDDELRHIMPLWNKLDDKGKAQVLTARTLYVEGREQQAVKNFIFQKAS